MKTVVSGEQSFKVLKDSFMCGPSSSGYVLAFSADNIHFTPYNEQAVPANENLLVNGAIPYSYWMLSGNTDNVVIIV